MKDLKDSLREKNILIRDLQTKLSLKPSGSSGMIHFEHGGEAAGGSDLSLREENERLKKALHIAASEVASAGGKKTVAGAGIAVAKDAKEDGDSWVAALVAPSEVFHLLNELMSSLGVAVEMLTGSGSRLIGGQRLAAAVERLQKMGYGQGGAVNSGVLFDWASFERLSKSLASV